jgi:hypothetical protein
MGGGFTLEPHRGCKPWAAVVRLTPAMLACLEGQPGRAAITLNATGDATLRVGDNSFTFASIPEDVPGDLIRGSLESESRSLRVAGSLRCRLQPKRALAGTDGLAARVKRRVEEEAGERRARRTMVTEFVAPPDGEKKTKRQRKTTKAGRETRAPKLSSVETKTDAKTDEEPRADDETENENAPRPVAAPPARVSERLAQLAGSAAKAASGRAANQLRAAALAILASRPLTFSAVHTAVSSGLASAGIAVPHRSVFEDAVKKLATYRAPGKYHLLDAAKTEGAELLAAAERDVPDQVTTPPLRFPEPPAFTRANGPPRLVDDDVAAGLTDDDEELWPDERVGPPAARAAGDAARDGEWERAAEKCVERMHRLGVCETFGVRPGKKAKEKLRLLRRRLRTDGPSPRTPRSARQNACTRSTTRRTWRCTRRSSPTPPSTPPRRAIPGGRSASDAARGTVPWPRRSTRWNTNSRR